MRLEASRPLIVTYDEGAASALDIAGRIARPVVVVLADSAHAQRMRPLFADACLAVHDLCEDDLTTKLDRHRPAGIQTFSEPLLPATSALAEALGLPFHDAAVVAALTRKDVQRQVLRAAGVDRTACVRLTDMRAWDDAIAQVGVPAVV
jgi:hypothetical protein